MTSISNTLRAMSVQLQEIADIVETTPPAPTELPVALDCLSKPWPAGFTYPVNYPAGDADNASVNLTYYDRKMANCPSGSVMIIGHSMVQDMVISKPCQTFGYGGESMRRTLNRIKRGGLIHRAGAVILFTGVNDIGNTVGNGPVSGGIAVDNLLYMHSNLAKAATGKWVVCHIPPVDEANSIYAGFNNQIARHNAGLAAAWVGSSATVAFVDVHAAMVDVSGNLADANHNGDGLHFSRAGHDIMVAAINVALATVL